MWLSCLFPLKPEISHRLLILFYVEFSLNVATLSRSMFSILLSEIKLKIKILIDILEENFCHDVHSKVYATTLYFIGSGHSINTALAHRLNDKYNYLSCLFVTLKSYFYLVLEMFLIFLCIFVAILCIHLCKRLYESFDSGKCSSAVSEWLYASRKASFFTF